MLIKTIKKQAKRFLAYIYTLLKRAKVELDQEELMKAGKLTIGVGSYAPPLVKYFDTESPSVVHIGKYCSISMNVKIMMGADHNIDFVTTFPFWIRHKALFSTPSDVKTSKGNVIIGNDVWIGRDVLIRNGVYIGDGAVIGACSLVTQDVKPYEVVGGVPAKHIKFRFSEEQISALLDISWWNWPLEKIVENQSEILNNNINLFIQKFRKVI